MTHMHVVLLQRDKWWIAQCLEHDIGAQAYTAEDAVYELQRSVVGHIIIAERHGQVPFATFPPAPKHYWDKFQGTELTVAYEQKQFQADAPMFAPRAEIRLAA